MAHKLVDALRGVSLSRAGLGRPSIGGCRNHAAAANANHPMPVATALLTPPVWNTLVTRVNYFPHMAVTREWDGSSASPHFATPGVVGKTNIVVPLSFDQGLRGSGITTDNGLGRDVDALLIAGTFPQLALRKLIFQRFSFGAPFTASPLICVCPMYMGIQRNGLHMYTDGFGTCMRIKRHVNGLTKFITTKFPTEY